MDGYNEQTEGKIHRQMDGWTDEKTRQIDGQMLGWIDRSMNLQIGRQTDRKIDRQTWMDRQIEKKMDE